jgi:DNA-binding HxlR family transcriptional regulator
MPHLLKRLPGPPMERVLKLISGRWKTLILWRLDNGPKRLSALRRSIPGVSQKVLIQQLRELEAHRLVTRTVFAEVPPRVEYRLTAEGESLRPILLGLYDWSQRQQALLDAIDGVAPGTPTWCERIAETLRVPEERPRAAIRVSARRFANGVRAVG